MSGVDYKNYGRRNISLFAQCIVTQCVYKLFTRDRYAIARICYRPSVHPSVTRVDHTKTVEVRIMTFSPYGSPIPLVFREQVSSRILKGSPRAGALNEGGVGKIGDFRHLSRQ